MNPPLSHDMPINLTPVAVYIDAQEELGKTIAMLYERVDPGFAETVAQLTRSAITAAVNFGYHQGRNNYGGDQ